MKLLLFRRGSEDLSEEMFDRICTGWLLCVTTNVMSCQARLFGVCPVNFKILGFIQIACWQISRHFPVGTIHMDDTWVQHKWFFNNWTGNANVTDANGQARAWSLSTCKSDGTAELQKAALYTLNMWLLPPDIFRMLIVMGRGCKTPQGHQPNWEADVWDAVHVGPERGVPETAHKLNSQNRE